MLDAHLLLWYIHIYIVLVHNSNFFQHFSNTMVFGLLLYPGTNSLWFLNILSWLMLQNSVTSLVACISVWLYATYSRLSGYTLASLWSSHSWDLQFPCISWTLLGISVTSSKYICLFISISNLFQTFGLGVSPYFKHFGLHVSPHIPYQPIITPGSSISIVSWSSHGTWKGWWALANFMTHKWWFLLNYFYIELDCAAESCRINFYSNWWSYLICIALDSALHFL